MSRSKQQHSHKYFHPAFIACLATSLLNLPSTAHAATRSGGFQLPDILRGDSAIESLQQAYQMIRQDPEVKSLLSDGKTNALSIAGKTESDGVATTRFQHYYKGVEVLGSMSFHHDTPNGVQVRNVIHHLDLDTQPTLTAEAAVGIAQSIAGERELTAIPELKIVVRDGVARLIYWVDIANEGLQAGYDILIDAHSGALIAVLSKMETLAPVQVVSAENRGIQVLPIAATNPDTGKPEIKGCKVSDLSKQGDPGSFFPTDQCKRVLRGQTQLTQNQCQVIMMDSSSSGDPIAIDPAFCQRVVTDGSASPEIDSTAQNALSNSTRVLNYYKNTHGRDSFDNRGAEVVSVVHAGLHYANAAWVQGLNFMIYGDGDGESMGDMTLGVDVAGHEMTHGVISKTAKLVSMDESGALNEAYADFFGKMIAEDGHWVMGAALAIDSSQFPGIRDLSEPGKLNSHHRNADGKVVSKPYPAHMKDTEKKADSTVCGNNNDRCWVHFNSTVPSHAAYKIFQAIGKEKTEQLYYLTLTQYLTPDATFRSSAEATVSACEAKFNAATCDAVKAVFTEVGML